MDLIEIFRTGTHTDSAGKTREWTDKDLEEIAALYNPEINEAPIVIGHPEHDSPAYGWVESLQVEGGKLLAKVKDVADEFKDWVRKGLYKKVSIALYPDLGLRHVGFLGATPPAIKGLKQAAFGEKQAAWKIETDFQYMEYWQQEMVKNIFDRLRDWMIEALKSESMKTAAVAVPEYSERESHADTNTKGGKHMDLGKFFTDLKVLVIGAEKELAPPDPDRPAHGTERKFTEAEVQAKVNEEKEKAYGVAEKERKEKLEFQEKLRTIETKARKDEIHAFCEALAKEGKLIPAWQKMGIEEFLFNLDSSGPLKFAEGHEKSPSQWFKDFITEIPKVVTFKEVAGDDKTKVIPKDFDTAVEAVMAEKKISRAKAITFCATQYPEIHEQYITNLKEITNK